MAGKINIAKAYVENGILAPNATYEELVKLDRKELSAIAKRIFENANRRMANIRAHGLETYSEVQQSILKTDGRAFRARGKSDIELVNAIRRAHFFLTQYGSTVKQALEVEKERRAAHPNLTREETRVVNRIYNQLHEKYPRFFEKLRNNNYSSDPYRQMVETMVISARKTVFGGLGGDLFADTKREIKASAAERQYAFEMTLANGAKEIEKADKKLDRQIKRSHYTKSPKFSAKDVIVDIDIDRI